MKLTLPLLATTGVGSFPKPDYVTESRGHLDSNNRKAVGEFIQQQEAIDMDVLVDGEFYRGDMATDYARALGLPIADWTRSYDNRFWKKGIVDRALERKEPIQLEQFKCAQGLTSRPVKAMLSGPTGFGAGTLYAAPMGLLAVIGSFLLFGMGTLAALTKHRWNRTD